MNQLQLLRSEVNKLANKERAVLLQHYFKTKKGEYGYGDIFLGLTVPQSRSIAIKFKDLSIESIEKLLQSKYHEERLIALLLLVHKFKKGSREEQKEIFDFYLAHTKYINNWDLVDLSAHKIVGVWLLQFVIVKNVETKQSLILNKLAKSNNMWERRIAVISTFSFIQKGQYDISLRIAEILLHDREDLIQKAVGWMLREIGKCCSQDLEEQFLKKHYKTMPRTMLRYAIERFPEPRRKQYLNNCV
jgi:3-methyladenine DNA glycosylase AlkD